MTVTTQLDPATRRTYARISDELDNPPTLQANLSAVVDTLATFTSTGDGHPYTAPEVSRALLALARNAHSNTALEDRVIRAMDMLTAGGQT